MNSWADIRDLAEQVITDGGVSSNYIAEAADCALDLLRVTKRGTPEDYMGYWVYSSLDGERYGCCDWERVACMCDGMARGRNRVSFFPSEYDPKAEGARKEKESWAEFDRANGPGTGAST